MKTLRPACALIIASATLGCGSRTPPETAPGAPGTNEAATAERPSEEHSAPAPLVHTVASGDTLWSLSRRYGVSVDDLARANELPDPDLLSIGDRLVIPGRVGSGSAPAAGADTIDGRTLAAARGDLPANAWVWPVSGGEVMSSFGARRGQQTHHGVDIRATSGQPVLAAFAGTVVYAGGGMSDYGNAVILDHGNGLTSLYGHNEELLVREGERVTRGQTIARAGRSGNATTVHLHFEVRRYAEALDPMRFLSSAGR